MPEVCRYIIMHIYIELCVYRIYIYIYTHTYMHGFIDSLDWLVGESEYVKALGIPKVSTFPLAPRPTTCAIFG